VNAKISIPVIKTNVNYLFAIYFCKFR